MRFATMHNFKLDKSFNTRLHIFSNTAYIITNIYSILKLRLILTSFNLTTSNFVVITCSWTPIKLFTFNCVSIIGRSIHTSCLHFFNTLCISISNYSIKQLKQMRSRNPLSSLILTLILDVSPLFKLNLYYNNIWNTFSLLIYLERYSVQQKELNNITQLTFLFIMRYSP